MKKLPKIFSMIAITLSVFTLTGCTSNELTIEQKQERSQKFYEDSSKELREIFKNQNIDIEKGSVNATISCPGDEDWDLGECHLNLNFNEPQYLDQIGEVLKMAPTLFAFLQERTYVGNDGRAPESCDKIGYCGIIDDATLNYRGQEITFPLDRWKTATENL